MDSIHSSIHELLSSKIIDKYKNIKKVKEFKQYDTNPAFDTIKHNVTHLGPRSDGTNMAMLCESTIRSTEMKLPCDFGYSFPLTNAEKGPITPKTSILYAHWIIAIVEHVLQTLSKKLDIEVQKHVNDENLTFSLALKVKDYSETNELYGTLFYKGCLRGHILFNYNFH